VKPQPKKKQAKKRASEDADVGPRKKRKSTEPTPRKPTTPQPQKQKAPIRKPAKKVVESSDDEDESALSDVEQDEQPEQVATKEAVGEEVDGNVSESEMSELIDDDPPSKKKRAPKKQAAPKDKTVSKKNGKAKTNKAGPEVTDDEDDIVEKAKNDGNASDSDLSSLIDEPPTKRKKKSTSTDTKAKKPKGKAAKDADLDPQEVEIKKLKDWLSKCGIRKMWPNYLAPYETPKKKIAHLKEMLKDAGMEGRPSIAKAHEIRDRRELAEELEEAQKFAQHWGSKKERDTGRTTVDAMAKLGFELDEDSE
jgi:hypothetical protein